MLGNMLIVLIKTVDERGKLKKLNTKDWCRTPETSRTHRNLSGRVGTLHGSIKQCLFGKFPHKICWYGTAFKGSPIDRNQPREKGTKQMNRNVSNMCHNGNSIPFYSLKFPPLHMTSG